MERILLSSSIDKQAAISIIGGQWSPDDTVDYDDTLWNSRV